MTDLLCFTYVVFFGTSRPVDALKGLHPTPRLLGCFRRRDVLSGGEHPISSGKVILVTSDSTICPNIDIPF